MCGHVGIAGDLEFKDEATMKRLLLFDVFRGFDSTGFAAMKNNGEVGIAKLPSHPIDLFQDRRFEKLLAGHASQVFLGHNRAATIGKVTGFNAHPFESGPIIGAHNGTLDLASWSRLETLIGHTTLSDSPAIIEAIDRFGIEATIAEMETGAASQRGAWALVWFDSANRTLNFLRNKHRPMWYGRSKDKKKLFWCSEWQTIAASLSLSTTAYELETSDEGFTYFEMEADWLYTFELDKLKKGEYKSVEDARVKKIEGREPPKVSMTTTIGAPFQRGNTTTTTTTQNGGTTTTSTTSRGGHSHDASSNVVDIWTARATEPYADYVDKERFEELAKYGCSWCQADIEYGETGVTFYDEYEMVLCKECSGRNDHNRVYLDAEAHKNLQQAK